MLFKHKSLCQLWGSFLCANQKTWTGSMQNPSQGISQLLHKASLLPSTVMKVEWLMGLSLYLSLHIEKAPVMQNLWVLTNVEKGRCRYFSSSFVTFILIGCQQGGTSCTLLQAGLWGFFQFMRIFEDFCGPKSEASHRRWKGCPQSSILSPQSSEMPENNVFAPKNLIYGILVANVARISTCALWG